MDRREVGVSNGRKQSPDDDETVRHRRGQHELIETDAKREGSEASDNALRRTGRARASTSASRLSALFILRPTFEWFTITNSHFYSPI